jgi:AbrB family looped-hinge helix DNA binding protein
MTVITRKGQVTVPAAIRRELGLQEGDAVEFVLAGGEARLIPRSSAVERTAGALSRYAKRPVAAEAAREAAERAIADEAERRAGR